MESAQYKESEEWKRHDISDKEHNSIVWDSHQISRVFRVEPNYKLSKWSLQDFGVMRTPVSSGAINHNMESANAVQSIVFIMFEVLHRLH